MTIIVQQLAQGKDYDWLKSAIATWLHRSDMGDIIPDLIVLAESKLSEDIQSKSMDTIIQLTTEAGNPFLDLPTDFRNMRGITLVSDPAPPLKYATPTELAEDYQIPSQQEKPRIYTIVGTQIRLAPTPDSAYDVEVTYERRIPALTVTSTTNWLLDRSPNVYLFASLLMAQPYIMDDARMAVFQAMYQDALNAINLTDWHTASQMRVRTDVRMPYTY
jgi:hypothetical protein